MHSSDWQYLHSTFIRLLSVFCALRPLPFQKLFFIVELGLEHLSTRRASVKHSLLHDTDVLQARQVIDRVAKLAAELQMSDFAKVARTSRDTERIRKNKSSRSGLVPLGERFAARQRKKSTSAGDVYATLQSTRNLACLGDTFPVPRVPLDCIRDSIHDVPASAASAHHPLRQRYRHGQL